MIENIIIKKLDKAISGIRAYGETPEKKNEEYMLIEKTDSGLEDQIWQSVIEVQSISKKSKFRASWMNDQVIKVLLNIQDSRIASCTLTTSYSSTKTATKEYRYKAVFEITHYQED